MPTFASWIKHTRYHGNLSLFSYFTLQEQKPDLILQKVATVKTSAKSNTLLKVIQVSCFSFLLTQNHFPHQ